MDAMDTATFWSVPAARPSHNESSAAVPTGECVDFTNDLPPDAVAEIASLFAKGFLRYWRSQRQRPLIAENQLDSTATQSGHVTVVNTTEKGED